MTVCDQWPHPERGGELAGLIQSVLARSDSPEGVEGEDLIDWSPLLDGHCDRPPRCLDGVGVAAGEPIELAQRGQPGGEVRPLLDGLAVRAALFEARDALQYPPRQSVGIAETHRNRCKPVMNLVRATDLQGRLEDLDGLRCGAEPDV